MTAHSALTLVMGAVLVTAPIIAFGLAAVAYANRRLLHYLANQAVNHHARQMSALLALQPPAGQAVDNIVASLSSTASRLTTAALAVESVLLQTMRPLRICLYLSDRIAPEAIPAALRRLEPFGLEIRFVEDVGPHTKLLYALRDFPDSRIFTFDDDIYYPANTLATLLKTAEKVPDAIVGNWVRQLRFTMAGKVRVARQGRLMTPKRQVWQIEHPPATIRIGYDLFAYGTGGVLYPPHCMDERVFDIATFKRLCPTEDDVWFKAMSLLKGTPVATSDLGLTPEHHCIQGSQHVALRHNNHGQTAKDQSRPASKAQIREVFAHFGLYAKLAELKSAAND